MPNPISLAQITGKSWPVETIFHSIYDSFRARVAHLDKNLSGLKKDYTARLLGYQKFLDYSAEGEIFRARLTDVLDTGEIILEQDSGKIRKYGFKQVRLVEA